MNKKTPHNVDWEIISRYLSKEMGEAELSAFEKEMEKNPEYAKLVNNIHKDCNTIEQIHGLEQKIDVDKAWIHLKNRFQQEHLLEKTKIHRTLQFPSWNPLYKVAALFVLIFALGFLFHQITQKAAQKYETVQTAYFEGGKTINLNDGSKIYLNGNTKLIYPNNFDDRERKVKLEGEAFFEIKPNKLKPFVITTENTEIRVLGTAFNVNTMNRKKVEVLVESGKVSFALKKKSTKKLILEKGDFGVIEQNNMKKSSMPDKNYMAWKTQHLVFKEQKLNEVIKVINRTYQVNIRFDDSLKNLSLTATFDNEPLEIILESLCRTFNMRYERDEADIRFVGKF